MFRRMNGRDRILVLYWIFGDFQRFCASLFLFLQSEVHEVHADKHPVKTIADDGTVGGRVIPAENSVEDLVAAVRCCVHIRVTPARRHYQYHGNDNAKM